MPFRFHRSFKLFPGFRLNLSRSGFSLSAGIKGLMLNFSRKGGKVTVGVPGTGVSWAGRLFGWRR